MRRCLEQRDVAGVRCLWLHVSPHLPQPKSDEEALATMHYARTMARSLSFKDRAYSHAWLVNNGLPSGLPDRLRPKAERIYPRVEDAVGLSVQTSSSNPEMKLICQAIERVMREAIMDEYSRDGKKDPAKVKRAMFSAKDKFTKKLYETVSTGWRK